MKISDYYLPLTKEKPAESSSTSHEYLIRAGLIKQTSAGIYSWLPLGTKLLHNITSIIREEMNKAGNLEVIMPCIQSGYLWKKSGRYDSYGQEMLKIQDRHNKDMVFSPTNEEMITDITSNNINSYKDLPKCFYQIQWKFRDEIRPRFGIMRAREFLMKDAYSFDIDRDNAIQTYQKMYSTYLKIFKRLELKAVAIKADTGPIGGDLSHEFHIFANTGESTVYYDARLEESSDDFNKLEQIYTAADDLHDPNKCNVHASQLKSSKAIEVGHIFHFGTKYSSIFNVKVKDQNGDFKEIHMGSYGIGISRLVAAIIEVHHDSKGIVWPLAIAPFKFGILNLTSDSQSVSEDIYNYLGHERVLFDDTKDSAGVKFARMDLLGIPIHIIIGKQFTANNIIQIKNRKTGELSNQQFNEDFFNILNKYIYDIMMATSL